MKQNSDFSHPKKQPPVNAVSKLLGSDAAESLSDLSHLKPQLQTVEVNDYTTEKYGNPISTQQSKPKEHPTSPIHPQSSSRPSQQNPMDKDQSTGRLRIDNQQQEIRPSYKSTTQSVKASTKSISRQPPPLPQRQPTPKQAW